MNVHSLSNQTLTAPALCRVKAGAIGVWKHLMQVALRTPCYAETFAHSTQRDAPVSFEMGCHGSQDFVSIA
jgi:hypothetical protein